ncbi:hypothetical protein [Pedobacter nototheniae]|uniref:hypothetical protein n=1 Tax=Pedobacter nototheniae TaxID=2488994 RepID=UPI00292F916B|nr:hypothetical protein [Pedobacter nototheniae]
MDFEDIQKSWQAQPVEVNTDHKLLDAQKDRWERNQQKLFRNNICMSLGFFVAMVVIGWVYFSFKDQYGLPFKISIATVYILMIVFLVINWRSYAFKKRNIHDSSQEYIQQQIKRLNWQKNIITKYTWMYTILLWLAMVMYIWEITMMATPTFRYTALGITTFYIFGITVWNRARKQKKQLKEIHELIADLENMKRGLNYTIEN